MSNFDEILEAVKRQDAIETEFNGEVCRLAAEVDRLRVERQAIIDAGGDLLWAGGAATLPEAVAGICHAFTVELDRRERGRDQSPAAKVRDTFPHLAFTDADLVRWAVERAGKGEYRRQRWAVVGEMFTRGSHVARELCRACGLDPDEMVGDDGEIEDIIGEDGGGGE